MSFSVSITSGQVVKLNGIVNNPFITWFTARNSSSSNVYIRIMPFGASAPTFNSTEWDIILPLGSYVHTLSNLDGDVYVYQASGSSVLIGYSQFRNP